MQWETVTVAFLTGMRFTRIMVSGGFIWDWVDQGLDSEGKKMEIQVEILVINQMMQILYQRTGLAQPEAHPAMQNLKNWFNL